MFSASKEFFNLEPCEKERFAREPVTTQGYVHPGMEMLDRLKLEPGDKACCLL